MKKTLLFLALIAYISTINAQEKSEYVLPMHDIQFSFGDGIIFNDMDIDRTLGSYSLSYHYNLKKWIALGVLVSYSPQKNYNYRDYYYTDYYYTDYGNNYNHRNSISFAHNLSLAFSVRFTYLNRPNVKLYSGTSLGLMHIIENGQKMRMNVSGQMTFFGFQFGKKFYIGGEVGYGVKGFFTTNLGYKF
ncbi:MAG: hypothetical protein LBB53_06340 [Prevotellaceae bacterium]|jgi:hypothetical protein|nr:hypothetical protein [Prevotellaceae bacterium]